eukprot:TRINITY_DN7909_c0_g1_i1.p1 TRINITY_DN7909_c0_g1~~TRINITY_DN7909_c0_g1_i1.p1  ORF type:complete len:419 (-),score=60.85 TRINITY_DN7909_c0_g1_i1:38-1294(-)
MDRPYRQRRSRSTRRDRDRSRDATRSRWGGRHRSRSRSRSHSRSRSRRARAESVRPQVDSEGHLVFALGAALGPPRERQRYKILSKMGEGTFGQVLECWDRRDKCYCAVKVIRNVDKYYDAAQYEIDVLRDLMRKDPENRFRYVRMHAEFEYYGHMCMVFERLGRSLYDLLVLKTYHGLPLAHVQVVAFQLLEAIAGLHSLSIVHTDLKPENILLVSDEFANPEADYHRVPRTGDIKLIDFGSATFEYEHHTTIVTTRHYRAPEVILEAGWSYACDVWSVGCILIELMTGDALFQTHSNREHLAMIEVACGPFPRSLIQRAAPNCLKYFEAAENVRVVPPHGQESLDEIARVRPITEMLRSHPEFLDLCRQLLVIEPRERISARAALAHPFFAQDYTSTLPASAQGRVALPRLRPLPL